MIAASFLALSLLASGAPQVAPAVTASSTGTHPAAARVHPEGEGALRNWLLIDDAPGSSAVAHRLVGLSERFLGTAYVHSPLGEGSGFDPDPTLRFDAVDCLTFVEETIALALSRSPADVPTYLERLRYAAQPTYEERNHLMEAQWLPNNVRKGFLRDITAEVGAQGVVRTRKVLTAESWSTESSRSLNLPVERQVVGEFEFDLIPLQHALAAAKKVPSGTILVVVREERALRVTRITHLGFVVHKRNRPYLRHAARSHYRQVVDEDLETFLLRNSKYSKWRVEGVALYQVRAPAEDVLVTTTGAGE